MMRNPWIIGVLACAALGSVGFVGMIYGAPGFGPQFPVEIRFLMGSFYLGLGLAVALIIGLGEIKRGCWIGWAENPEKHLNHLE